MEAAEAECYPAMSMQPSEKAAGRARGSSAPRRYHRPVVPVHFPEHEEVGETKLHLEVREALYQSVKLAFADRATIGSDQFLYWDPTDPARNQSPDLMLRLGEPDSMFRVWKVWERGAPQIAVEVI